MKREMGEKKKKKQWLLLLLKLPLHPLHPPLLLLLPLTVSTQMGLLLLSVLWRFLREHPDIQNENKRSTSRMR